jgi:hypothetical protein
MARRAVLAVAAKIHERKEGEGDREDEGEGAGKIRRRELRGVVSCIPLFLFFYRSSYQRLHLH